MTQKAHFSFFQGSDDPVFKCEVGPDEHLTCVGGCGQILIENFVRDQFGDISIRCSRCAAITTTPRLELGEIFAGGVLKISAGDGSYFMGDTVSVPPGVVVTTDAEIELILAACSPRNDSVPFELSQTGLASFAAAYEAVASVKFADQAKVVDRLGLPGATIFPLAWAIRHLERKVEQHSLEFGPGADIAALTCIQLYRAVVGKWSHHPRFHSVSKGLGKPKSFLHTACQLLIADHLFACGNQIGISLEDVPGEPNPDLYMRGPFGPLYIEVKAPEALQWTAKKAPDDEDLGRIVRRSLKSSYRQINRKRPGILVLASTLLGEDFPDRLQKQLSGAIRSKGRDHRSMAAIVSFGAVEAGFHRENDRLLQTVLFKVVGENNPHSQGLPYTIV